MTIATSNSVKLSDPKNILLFCFRKFLISFFLSSCVLYFFHFLNLLNYEVSRTDSGFVNVFFDVLIVPFIESILLVIIIYFFDMFLSLKRSAITSGLIFASFHSMIDWIWGIIVLPLFIISCLSYQETRNEETKIRFMIVFLIHAFNNLAAHILGAILD